MAATFVGWQRHARHFALGLEDGSGLRFVRVAVFGASDASLSVPVARQIASDRTVWAAVLSIVRVNLLLYGVPLALVPAILDILLSKVLVGDDSRASALGSAARVLSALYSAAFAVLFSYPMFVLSIVLSTKQLQQISDRIVVILSGRAPAAAPIDLPRTVCRVVIMNVALVLKLALVSVAGAMAVWFVGLVPGWVGDWLASALVGALTVFDLSLTVWLYAFYSLEMTTSSLALEARVAYLELRWAYFFGLALPFTVCTYWMSLHWATVFYFLLSPAFVAIMQVALYARGDQVTGSPLPLFAAPMACAALPNAYIRELFARPQAVVASARSALSRLVARASSREPLVVGAAIALAIVAASITFKS